jgi:ribosome-associated protein
MRETTVTSITNKKSRKKSAKASAPQPLAEIVRDLVEVTLENKNATDVVTINLKGKSDIADYMIVASGTSTRHAGALAGYVVEVLKKVGINPVQIEGEGNSEWIVIDNPLVIVHLFHPETRAVYNLEKMWSAEFKDD